MSDASAETRSGPSISIHERETREGDPLLRSDSPEMDRVFEIEEPIGEGGMNCIYRARNIKTGKFVALRAFEKAKKGKEKEEVHAKRMERMRREVRVLENLEHVNLPEYFGSFIDQNGDGYIVIELIEGGGGELSKVIQTAIDSHQGIKPQGSHVAKNVIKAVGTQLLNVVAKLHSLKIIHRDIKPRNIMYSKTSKGILIKLIDFGLGKILNENMPNDSLTQVESMMGSGEYMAPEQVVDAKNADHRADLYAVGAVLYEMVTGQLLVDLVGCDTSVQVYARLFPEFFVSRDPTVYVPFPEEKYPRHFVEDVNPHLEKLILDLLERDPAKRPQTATEALKRFEEAMAFDSRGSSPMVVSDPPPPPRSSSRPSMQLSDSLGDPIREKPKGKLAIVILVMLAALSVCAFVGFKLIQSPTVKSSSSVSTTTERSPFSSPSVTASVSASATVAPAPVQTASAPRVVPKTVADLAPALRTSYEAAKRQVLAGGLCLSISERQLMEVTDKVPDFPDPYFFLAECVARKKGGGTDTEKYYRDQYTTRSGGRTSPP